jgi:hypothetical protein
MPAVAERAAVVGHPCLKTLQSPAKRGHIRISSSLKTIEWPQYAMPPGVGPGRESRYDHRLHGVLLVAHGVTCPEVAALLGDAPRSVEYWVHRFQQKGLAGLQEGEHAGRPCRLDEKQMEAINRALRGKPSDVAHVDSTRG